MKVRREKVFVTGADGMLGSSVCRTLISDGFRVKAFCFPESPSRSIQPLDLEICYGDVLDPAQLVREMKDCDFVIHIAALTNVWPRKNKKVTEVNLNGTRNTFHSAIMNNVRRFVHVGSASSFSHGSKQQPGDEQNAYNGWDVGMDYLDSKYMAQEFLLKESVRTSTEVIIVNPTFMIGPYDSAPSSGKMIQALVNRKIPGYTSGGKNFVYSGDVARAIVNGLDKGKPGQCYIAGGQNLSYEEFFRMACEATDTRFDLRSLPSLAVLTFGAISSIWARITGSPPKVSYGMAKFSLQEQYFSAQKAVNELQMPQTPMQQAIKECYNWLVENNYLRK